MSAPLHVLVVDDEPVVREAVRRVLEAEGMRTTLVASGAEALRHPALADCALLLCDLMLPDMPGLEVVREARARRRDLPVVAISGYATGEVAAAAAAAGVHEFLPKPFDQGELLDRIRGVLERSGAAVKEGRP